MPELCSTGRLLAAATTPAQNPIDPEGFSGELGRHVVYRASLALTRAVTPVGVDSPPRAALLVWAAAQLCWFTLLT